MIKKIDKTPTVKNPGTKNPPHMKKQDKKKNEKSEFDKELEKVEKKLRGSIEILEALRVHSLDTGRSNMARNIESLRVDLVRFMIRDFHPVRGRISRQ